jgi:tetratricopeptide (TPR) repeat protein
LLSESAPTLGLSAQLLWQIGGGDPKVIGDCPLIERVKFFLLAFLNLMLALAAGAIVGWASRVFVSMRMMSLPEGIPPPFSSTTVIVGISAFVGIISLLVSLALLAWAVRTYYASKAPSISVYDRMTLANLLPKISALSSPVLIAGIVTIAQRVALRGNDVVSSDADVIVLAVLVALYASPVVLAIGWPSPVYEHLLGLPKLVVGGPDIGNSKAPVQGGWDVAAQDSGASPGKQRLIDEERELSALFERYPDSRQLADRLVAAQRSLGLFDRALNVYDKLIEKNPRDVELLRLKAQLYREKGDEDRYRKMLEEADRLHASVSFEDNLGKAITIRKFGAKDLQFFADFDWPLQPGVNVLLGRNGYGKSYLLRGLVALLQEDEELTRGFLGSGRSGAQMRMTIDREGSTAESVRTRLLFERRFGKVAALAIPDVRYIDKSKDTVGAGGGQVSDLKSQGAQNFLHEESLEGLITNFLYEICLDQRDYTKRPDSPLIKLVEKCVDSLAGTKFEFSRINKKDNALFEILVETESSPQPLPIQNASQGTLSVAAMVGLIYKYLKAVYPDVEPLKVPLQRAIVIIDEIDAHLHPSWQQKILHLFRTTFPNVQFIVTAHSPLVVAGARGGEVAVLARRTAAST